MSTWLRHKSFQARLSTLVAAAVGIAVALAALAAYFTVSNQLYSGVSNALSGDLKSCTKASGDIETGCLLRVNHQGGGVAIFDASGQNITSQAMSSPFGPALSDTGPTIKPTSAQLAVAGTAAGTPTTADATYSGKPYRVLAKSVYYNVTTPAVLLIAQPLSSTVSTLEHLRLILALVILLGVGIAVLLGSLVAMSTIQPVKRLTAAAEHVAETQSLDATIDEVSDDELGRLAHAFNQMLVALRASRRQQAQLVSDAGHELRTPLTSLRTNIEFLMRAQEMPESDRQDLLGDVEDQLEELTALVGDIVETARQDEQPQREYTEVRLDMALGRAVERARRRAPSLTFAVEMTSGSVRAQPALLERAVLNVLDNAAKWSPPAGTVEVRLRRDDQWLLEVRDHGPGIAPNDLPRVFDRFYRAPTARSMPGSGLGLAIVSQVITDHGGSVEATLPPGGGTLIRICLPIVDEDEPALDAPVPLIELGPAPEPDTGPAAWAPQPPPPPPPPTPWSDPAAEAQPSHQR